MKKETVNKRIQALVTEREESLLIKKSRDEDRSISHLVREWICEKLGILKKK